MTKREQEVVIEDEGGMQERRDHGGSTRIARRDLHICNFKEDPNRFLERYTLACRANNEGGNTNQVRLFPLALIGFIVNWFLNMDMPQRLRW